MKIKVLVILMGFCLLSQSCAVNAPTTQKYTESRALEVIKNEVGTTVPSQGIFHSYQEIASETYTGSVKHDCNKSKVLSIVRNITFSKIEGNYVEGAVIYRDDCSTQHYTFKGRFDAKRLIILTDGGAIREFVIEQNGRLLRLNRTSGRESLTGTPSWSNVTQNGGQPYSSKSVYKTTYYLSTSDVILGKSKEGNSASPSLTSKLQELKELHDKGIITKAEYEAARKKAIEGQ